MTYVFKYRRILLYKVLIKAVKESGCCLITDDYVNKTPHTDTQVAGHLFTLHSIEATN